MSKKRWIGGIAFAGLLVGSLTTGSVVLAADEDTGTTNMSVTVTGGTIGLSAPSALAFPDVTVESIVKGNLNVPVTTAGSSLLTVSDFRGTGAGYTVSAKASSITNSNGATLKGAFVQMVPDTLVTPNAAAPAWTKSVDLSTSDQPLFATSTGQDGGGITSYDLNKVTLNVPEDNDVKAGNYSGVITFALTPGQPAQAATSNPVP
ncbi:hypothetical protein BVJ53_05735 [Lacticaseibacillus chiayiensis]|uniref:WxL domain-containing protein n=1 Tax=Lacticaseibacillus chiayiensis TaxID=2100821 RepID=A0A4Q1U6F9_9LACO|nr:WxL domain-containing protein [Lacticaseibacillus chiayiensis]RXT26851.1 hypothetical protein BVJ53_05735 [Lacticaseibacillus chiayiensis]UYN55741.1 WxL domain-containing protein [Lacticaseibacillus chiayiensis]